MTTADRPTPDAPAPAAEPIEPAPRGPTDRLGPHLAFFLRETPTVLLPVFVVVLGLRVALGGWSWADLAFAGFLVAFNPFSEWLIHRVLQHSQPHEVFGRVVQTPQSRTHRRHHEHPWTMDYILLGKRRSVDFVLTQGLILLVVSLVVFRQVVPALTALCVSIVLTLVYEWSHYLMHTAYRPRSAWFRRRWQTHRRHHFRDDRRWFGINGLVADRLLGTADPAPR